MTIKKEHKDKVSATRSACLVGVVVPFALSILNRINGRPFKLQLMGFGTAVLMGVCWFIWPRWGKKRVLNKWRLSWGWLALIVISILVFILYVPALTDRLRLDPSIIDGAGINSSDVDGRLLGSDQLQFVNALATKYAVAQMPKLVDRKTLESQINEELDQRNEQIKVEFTDRYVAGLNNRTHVAAVSLRGTHSRSRNIHATSGQGGTAVINEGNDNTTDGTDATTGPGGIGIINGGHDNTNTNQNVTVISPGSTVNQYQAPPALPADH